MAVEVRVDEVESTMQFGCMPGADIDAMGNAYLQLFSLSHSVLVTQLSIAAAMYNKNVVDYPFGNEEGHRGKVVEFFTYRCKMSHRQATEHVRVAIDMQDLPLTTAALAKGNISYQQLTYLTQFLTPETEAEYIANLHYKTLAGMKRLAHEAQLARKNASKKPDNKKSVDGYDERELRWWPKREGGWRFTVDLSDGQAAIVSAAIERETDGIDKDPVTNEFRPLAQRRADAFVTIASAHLADDADHDRATVSIHCDLEQFENQDGVVDVDGLPTMMSSVAGMLCDSRFQLISERNGVPVGIGRVSRDIPHWLRRLLWLRDKGCRFPNCENTKGVQGHHIKWWRFFGETNIDNLILLCSRHHHLIHDKNWEIVGDPNHDVEFRDPGGQMFTSRLPHLKPKIVEFANGLLGQKVDGLRLFA